MKKSQSSFEFIVLASIMMFIFIIFFAITTSKIADFAKEKNEKVANDVIDTVLEEISIAYSSMQGYSRIFILPPTIEGEEYEITIDRDRILLLMYKNQIYERELPAAVFGTVYKGENTIRKTESGITLFGQDPCLTLDKLPNTYCLGGFFYCHSGYYDSHCDKEDDSYVEYCNKVPKPPVCLISLEGTGCTALDTCNFAPGIIFEPEYQKVMFDGIEVNDTQIRMLFRTNESSAAFIELKDDVLGQAIQYINEPSLLTSFNISLANLTPNNDYFFTINITDRKRADNIYPECCLAEDYYQFRTGPDKTAPIIKKASVILYDNTEKDPFNYNDRIKINATVQEYTGVHELTAYIKLDGHQLREIPLACVRTCGSGETEDGWRERNFESEEASEINSTFAANVSYGNDSHTLFYAGFDDRYEEFSGEQPSDPHNLPLFDEGRFGSGVRMDSGTEPQYRLPYLAEGNINSSQGTIEFWVKPLSTSETTNFFFDVLSYDQSEQPIPNQNEIEIEKTNNRLKFRIYDSGGAEHLLEDTSNLELGQWHFIAVSWKKVNSGSSNAEINLFVDGESRNYLGSQNIDLDFGQNTKIAIGYSLENPMQYFRADSIIDQFRILDYPKMCYSGCDIEEMRQDYYANHTYTLDFYAEDDSGNCDGENCRKTYINFTQFNISYGR